MQELREKELEQPEQVLKFDRQIVLVLIYITSATKISHLYKHEEQERLVMKAGMNVARGHGINLARGQQLTRINKIDEPTTDLNPYWVCNSPLCHTFL